MHFGLLRNRRRLLFFGLTFALLAFLLRSPSDSPAHPTESLVRFTRMSASTETAKQVRTSLTAFTLDLFGKLRAKAPSNNVFFSPLSFASALTMLRAGARGETRDEIDRLLHFSEFSALLQGAAAEDALGQLNGALTAESAGHIYRSASGFWPQAGLAISNAYVDAMSKSFHAAIEALDYAGNHEAARQHINKWVEGQTNQLIKDLIPPGGVDSSTSAVLANAVYFKGIWSRIFDAARSVDNVPFICADGRATHVRMMHMNADENTVRYGHSGNAAAIELTYGPPSHPNGDPDQRYLDNLSMIVILPDERGAAGLAELDKIFANPKSLSKITTQLFPNKVAISLPAFRVEYSVAATEVVQQLGMKKAFSPEADLSGITESTKIAVSDVFHKAFVEVNEQGTEAAAATAIVMKRSIARNIEFVADHAFGFLLWQRSTQTILFAGILADPAK